MAVFWFDPWATTNGTGTYASPFSKTGGGRSGFSDGDELRIKSVTTTSMLDSGSDSGTLDTTGNARWKILISSATQTYSDWDVLYFPTYDTWWRVRTATDNGDGSYTLTGLSGNIVPVPLNDDTSFTIKKLSSSYQSAITTDQYLYVLGQNNTATITDGWTSETTRVTDGSVTSLLVTDNTGYPDFRIGSSDTNYSSPLTNGPKEISADMTNTVILMGKNTSSSGSAYINFNNYGYLKLRQVSTGGSSYSGPQVYFNCGVENDFLFQVDNYCVHGNIANGLHNNMGRDFEGNAGTTTITIGKYYSRYNPFNRW